MKLTLPVSFDWMTGPEGASFLFGGGPRFDGMVATINVLSSTHEYDKNTVFKIAVEGGSSSRASRVVKSATHSDNPLRSSFPSLSTLFVRIVKQKWRPSSDQLVKFIFAPSGIPVIGLSSPRTPSSDTSQMDMLV